MNSYLILYIDKILPIVAFIIMSKSILELYIIGNGFDNHHGVDSSYFEYRMWLKENYEHIYWEIINLFGIDDESKERKVLLDNRMHPWWKSFEISLGEIDLADIVDNCVYENYPNFSSDEFRDRDYHAAEFDAELKLSKLVSDIKSTFEEWISSLKAPDKNKRIHVNRANAYFITFNYTDTLESLYAVPKELICHIHGKANNNEELIVGHNKSWEDLEKLADNTPAPPEEYDDREKLEEWHSSHGDFITDQTRVVAVREYVNLQKDTHHIISKNKQMFNLLSDVEKIHVYGFSFSEVDICYIEEIVSVIPPQTPWEISYYSDSEMEYFSKVMQSLKVDLENIVFVKLNDLIVYENLQYPLIFDS